MGIYVVILFVLLFCLFQENRTTIYGECLFNGETKRNNLNTINKNRNKMVVLFLFFILLIIYAFRDLSVGTDTKNYESMFDYFNINIPDWTGEPMFWLLAYITKVLGLSFQFLMFLIGFLILYGLFKTIISNSVLPFVSLFLCICLNVFGISMNIVRQCMAVSFFMMSIGSIKNRKPVSYLMYCALAIFCHNSAIVFLPMYFLSYIKVNKKTLSILSILTIILIFTLKPLVKIVCHFISRDYYGTYIIGGAFSGKTKIIYILFDIFLILLAVWFLYIRKNITNQKDRKNFDLMYWIYLIGVSIRTIATLGEFAIMINRISLYFLWSVIILIPYTIKYFPKREFKEIYLLTVILGSLGYFYLTVMRVRQAEVYPYEFLFERSGLNAILTLILVVLTCLTIYMLSAKGKDENILFLKNLETNNYKFIIETEYKDNMNKNSNLSRIKFVKFGDVLSIFLLLIALIPALITKLFVRDFWLVCEDKNEARDNGYWFFKYIREKYPKQKVAYAINKKSPDYNKVKNLGKVISFGGLSHWFWYIVADKNISSQKGGKPNAALCYLFEVVFKFRKNNRIFLQHGIIINDTDFLHYKKTNMRMFVTTTKPEYDYVSSHFGYPDGYVKLLGLPRFDNLDNSMVDDSIILAMPTWRQWLSKETEAKKIEGSNNFVESNYYKAWTEFLNSKELSKILKDSHKKLMFFPHRNMQKYLSNFQSKDENIIICDWKNYDIQEMLKKASIMITDYSSVFFDFLYMKKPVIFYQFDEQKFRQYQYAEGYFNYHKNGMTDWSDNLDDLLQILKDKLSNKKDCAVSQEVYDSYFKYGDNNNCQRVFEAIKGLKNDKKMAKK